MINYTGFNLKRTNVIPYQLDQISLVVHTDTIIFAWSKRVVDRLKRTSLKENTYGWGIGWIAASFTYANQGLAVVDSSIKVKHPKSRGYKTHEANQKQNEYLKQLTLEAFFCRLISSFMAMNDIARKHK